MVGTYTYNDDNNCVKSEQECAVICRQVDS